MGKVCEEHGVKLLTYGTLVCLLVATFLELKQYHTELSVRRLPSRQVARSARARALPQYRHPESTQGTNKTTLQPNGY
jgi:hypothetical protein